MSLSYQGIDQESGQRDLVRDQAKDQDGQLGSMTRAIYRNKRSFQIDEREKECKLNSLNFKKAAEAKRNT